jgi:chorismate dehydratase
LNAEAFYVDMERRGLELRELLPPAIGPAILNDEIDAGPVPLVDAFRLEDQCKPVAGFCIASTERARSVLFYSTRPAAELDGARIAVPDLGGTSHRLLQVLLSLKYGVEPETYVGMEDTYDAFLVTDDQALRRRFSARGYPHRYDLGEEWFRWTNLPFVFSRWVARDNLDAANSLLLEDTLYVGLEEGVELLFHESEPRDRLLMLPKDIVEYIQGLRFFIGLSERKAINLFRQHIGDLKLEE